MSRKSTRMPFCATNSHASFTRAVGARAVRPRPLPASPVPSKAGERGAMAPAQPRRARLPLRPYRCTQPCLQLHPHQPHSLAAVLLWRSRHFSDFIKKKSSPGPSEARGPLSGALRDVCRHPCPQVALRKAEPGLCLGVCVCMWNLPPLFHVVACWCLARRGGRVRHGSSVHICRYRQCIYSASLPSSLLAALPPLCPRQSQRSCPRWTTLPAATRS